MARRSDGSVAAWGYNVRGQCNVPSLPAGLRYVEISAGDLHSVARRSDGSIVAWGRGDFDQRLDPALAPGFSWVEIDAGGDRNVARFEPTSPPSAPDITAVTPATIEALMPGTGKVVRISGLGLDRTTSLLLDGTVIDFSRFTTVSGGTIMLDMPQTSTLGVHDLEVTDGVSTDTFQVTVVAPGTPRYELGTGDALNVIHRDAGLSFILSGQPGSVHRVFASPSNVPSSNAYVSLDLGNNFSNLFIGGQYLIPAPGWVRVNLISSALPDPGSSGTTFFSQVVDLTFPAPLEASNLQSIVMLR